MFKNLPNDSIEKKSFSTIFIIAVILTFLTRWIYVYNFDFDLMLGILIPIKSSGPVPINEISHYQPLLYFIFNGFNQFLSPYITLSLIGCLTLFLTFFLIQKTILFFTNSQTTAFLAGFFYFSILTFNELARSLDDNLFQVPLALASFYILWRYKIGIKTSFIAGLLFSIMCSIHLQTAILAPLLVLLPFFISPRSKIKYAVTIAIGIGAFVTPMIISIMYLKGYTSISDYFKLSSYTAFAHDPNLYLFAGERTFADIIIKVFNKFIDMIGILSICPLDMLRIRIQKPSEFLPSLILIIFNAIWFAGIVYIIAKGIIKSRRKEMKMHFYFLVTNLFLFLLTAITAYIFDEAGPERWVVGAVFIALNIFVALNLISKDDKFVLIFSNIPKSKSFRMIFLSYFSIITYALIIIFVTNAFNIVNAAFRYKKDFFAYPNIQYYQQISKVIPPNSLVICGQYTWLPLSYIYPGLAYYYDIRHFIENGKISKTRDLTLIMNNQLKNSSSVFAIEGYDAYFEHDPLIDYRKSVFKNVCINGTINKLLGINDCVTVYKIE